MVTQTEKSPVPSRGWLSTCWLRFALAITFLTRIPLPIRAEVTPADLQASMGWYPLIGLGLGALGWGLFYVGIDTLPPLLTAALVVILLEMFTGALHLDGLMDTCDGIGSGAKRERALEIMKDSRVGAMGVFGAIAIIMVKVTALASLTSASAMLPLLVGWMAARAIPALNVTFFQYARTAGTGEAFTKGKSPWVVGITLVTTVVAAHWLDPEKGLVLAILIIAGTLLVQAGIARKLQGLTGDVYGMGVEIAEAFALIVACGML